MNDQAGEMALVADSARNHAWADWLGMTTSIGCAIHCAAMPLVVAYLPALGLSWLAGKSFHQWIAAACFVLALLAFVPGWRIHRRFFPATLGTVGLSIITASSFGLAGDCCQPREGGDTSMSAVPTESHGTTCTDACCEHACDERNLEVETATLDSGARDFFSAFTDWWSPLGGALLVAAHLLNRSFACRCPDRKMPTCSV
jgi:hypothetical protein